MGEVFFLEVDNYETRIAEGVFNTPGEAKSALAEYAYEQGITEQPIEWGGIPDRLSVPLIPGYLWAIIKRMPIGEFAVHENLETFGEFDEVDESEGE